MRLPDQESKAAVDRIVSALKRAIVKQKIRTEAEQEKLN